MLREKNHQSRILYPDKLSFKSFPKIRNKARTFLILFFNTPLEVLPDSIKKKKKEIEGIQIIKDGTKLSSFTT